MNAPSKLAVAVGSAALVACALVSAPGARAAAGDAAEGKKVFGANCTACHSATTNEAQAGPGLKDLFKNKKLPGTGRPTNEANVRKQILDGGGGMPGFEGSLSDAQIDDLIAYLKTL